MRPVPLLGVSYVFTVGRRGRCVDVAGTAVSAVAAIPAAPEDDEMPSSLNPAVLIVVVLALSTLV